MPLVTSGFTGPASATDNAVVRWDATTGRVVQDSAVTIDDSGRMRVADGVAATPAVAATSDTDTGIYFAAGLGSDKAGVLVSGASAALTWDKATGVATTYVHTGGRLWISDGAANGPGLGFYNAASAGLYRSAANEISITTQNTQRIAIDSARMQLMMPLQLPSYTVAGVPAATTAGRVIYVSNETGGATLAFSDGTNWRRVTDNAIIS